ncbi:class II aldolase/adducin family protein [Nigerium massiliense]|uniref:class II aldolase/adducin family protein n=1 Tax=Nigerium massiliense TaxID=1522317 RepID=UPI00058F7415|nr:class II aldolase/adducin family protein [Nigerium massiliense]
MLLEQERAEVVRICQEMQRQGLVVGTAGNVSVRVDDRVVISPSGMEYADLEPGDVGVHDLTGEPVDARFKPSSELPLHLAVYAATDAGAIVHNHAPASTALGLLVDEIPATHYYSAMFGGLIRVAPYATFGTAELADNVARALDGRLGALMANHGAITVGPTLSKAFSLLPYLEYVCEVQLRAMAASPATMRVLSPEQMREASAGLSGYGQSK